MFLHISTGGGTILFYTEEMAYRGSLQKSLYSFSCSWFQSSSSYFLMPSWRTWFFHSYVYLCEARILHKQSVNKCQVIFMWEALPFIDSVNVACQEYGPRDWARREMESALVGLPAITKPGNLMKFQLIIAIGKLWKMVKRVSKALVPWLFCYFNVEFSVDFDREKKR